MGILFSKECRRFDLKTYYIRILFDILKFKYHNIKILTRTGMEL